MKHIKNQIPYSLIIKLGKAFRGRSMILTGQGDLSRKELRQLERAKQVKSRPAKLDKSGAVIRAWTKLPVIDMKKVKMG